MNQGLHRERLAWAFRKSKENSTEPAFGGTGHDCHKAEIHDPDFYAFS